MTRFRDTHPFDSFITDGEVTVRTGEVSVEAVVAALRGCPVRYASELSFHRDLAAGLVAAGIACERERRLTPMDRLDLAVDVEGGMIAIEVKVKGGVSEVDRQVARYAAHPNVVAVVVVSSRVLHAQAARESNGKPVHVVIRADGAFR